MEPAMWEDLQRFGMKTDALMLNNPLFSFFLLSKIMKMKYWRVINQVDYLLMLHHYYVRKSMRFWGSIVTARKRGCWKVMFSHVFVRPRGTPLNIPPTPKTNNPDHAPRTAPPSRTISLGTIHTTGLYPPGPYPPPSHVQLASGGTHPTGMLSCFFCAN